MEKIKHKGKRLNVFLNQEDYNRLKLLSKALGLKKTELVKISLKFFCNNASEVFKSQTISSPSIVTSV